MALRYCSLYASPGNSIITVIAAIPERCAILFQIKSSLPQAVLAGIMSPVSMVPVRVSLILPPALAQLQDHKPLLYYIPSREEMKDKQPPPPPHTSPVLPQFCLLPFFFNFFSFLVCSHGMKRVALACESRSYLRLHSKKGLALLHVQAKCLSLKKKKTTSPLHGH